MDLLPKEKENAEIRHLAVGHYTTDENGWIVTSQGRRPMRYQEELASFESVVQGVSAGGRWVDPDTPLGTENVPVAWKWPEEVWNPLCVTPTLFREGGTASDVTQGKCGSCWFLADLCVVAMHPSLMDGLVVAHDAERGVYCFRFFTLSGEERRVCVDSRIPVAIDAPYFKPAYASSKEPGELWPTLIEKAMAKVCGGSYQSISGGLVARGISGLLGCVPRSYQRTLQTEYQVEPRKSFANPDDLWGLMYDSLWLKGFLMDVAFLANPEESGVFEGGETVGFANLVVGHCYGVLGLYAVGPRLVKFRNPWGVGHEWTGAWADGSTEWNSLDQATKDSVGYKEEADGSFFMSIGDLARNLDQLGAARVFTGRAEVGAKRILEGASARPSKKTSG